MFADRTQLIQVGMFAVMLACAVFSISRLAVQLGGGGLTPWWANAAGLLIIAVLWLWWRRDPPARTTRAIHVTGATAVLAMLPPVAYGMPSTLWWLALVPFAMFLMADRLQGWVWTAVVLTIIGVASWAEPWIQVEGAAGEDTVEVVLARMVFGLLLAGIAAGFRHEVERQTADLAASNAAKTQFLAQVSHDLRNPLHGVLAMTDLALQEPLTPTVREKLDASQASAHLLLRLLNEVLDASRASSGKLELVSEAFDLHGLLQDVITPFARQATSEGLYFTAVADPGLQATRTGDAIRVGQIVMNLVSNAQKYTEEGRIDVHLSGDSAGLILEVRDTGRGVRDGDHERIFAPFEQSRSEDGALGGVGLGLAISRLLARRMEGELTSERVPHGALFRLVLPLQGTGPAQGPTELLLASLGKPITVSPLHVEVRALVVDDDPTNRRILAAFLRKMGMRVELAEHGAVALERCAEVDFDLVLTDAQMPVMGGLELVQRLRADGYLRPIIVCTASGSDDVWTAFEEAGANAALWKPFVLDDVVRVVQDSSITSVMSSEGAGT